MVTVCICSNLKTNSVVFTNIVKKNSPYFVGTFNKTILLFGRGPNRVMGTVCFDANVQ